jgi:fucose permease
MIQVVALMSVFGLGIAFSVIGALKLELVKVLGIDDARFGKLISTLMFTSIFVVLAFGPIVDIFGYRPVAILGFLLGSAALAMLVMARSYGTAIVACVILGIGAMCLNLGNTLIPMVLLEGNPAAAANFGNVFFGLGAFLTPFLAGMLLGRLGYRTTGMVIACILFVPVFFAAMATFPATEKTGVTFAGAVGGAVGLLANPVVVVSALALFFYIGLEVSMGGWISTYAAAQGFSDKSANIILSMFWIGLMVARLIASVAVTTENGVMAIAVLALVATASIGIMVATRSKTAAGVLIVLTGMSFGPMFPTIAGLTFAGIDRSLHGSAFGIIFAVGLLGGSTIPAAIGYYSRGKTIQRSMAIAMAAAFLLFVTAVVMGTV